MAGTTENNLSEKDETAMISSTVRRAREKWLKHTKAQDSGGMASTESLRQTKTANIMGQSFSKIISENRNGQLCRKETWPTGPEPEACDGVLSACNAKLLLDGCGPGR